MKLDGITPSQGPGPLDRNRKPDSKAGGKSFADALGKAQANPPPVPGAALPAAASNPAGDIPAVDSPSMGDPLDAIRFRLQSGYYNNAKIDDALSDRLSGYFDEIA
jgi:hypothetical protein